MGLKAKRVSKIGGQAVLEGVMMRGESSLATAVRDEYDEIVIESSRLKSRDEKHWFFKLPIVRGVVSFLDSLVKGTKILLRSAEVWGSDDAEPTKLEKWLAEKTRFDILDIAIFLGLIFGLGLSIGLFFVLPQVITTGLIRWFDWDSISSVSKNLITGGIRILIFVLYISLVSFIKDIRRTFMYHGAEHKVINAFEAELELTVANIQTMPTRNDRCGTTFIFLVMIVSIIMFSFLGWQENLGIRLITRLALLPLVAGVSYEFLKLFAKSDNLLFKIFKYPGLLLQKITTKEPEDKMIEVALTAFLTVQAMDKDKSYPTSNYVIKKNYLAVRNEITTMIYATTKEVAEVDWIFSEVTKKNRSELPLMKYVTEEQYKKALQIAKERATGKPLQYILGNTNFYGYDIKVDERVLIPRCETEILVESIMPLCKDKKVLDMCTGSGAIAIAISKGSNAVVVASDISDKALELAGENAKINDAEIEFVQSDLFTNIKGKYDIITINPPYISSAEIATLQGEVRDYEPREALDGGEDGLDIIKRIANDYTKYLSDKGTLIMEVGIGQTEDVAKLFTGTNIEIIKDLEKIDRFVKVTRNV